MLTIGTNKNYYTIFMTTDNKTEWVPNYCHLKYLLKIQ